MAQRILPIFGLRAKPAVCLCGSIKRQSNRSFFIDAAVKSECTIANLSIVGESCHDRRRHTHPTPLPSSQRIPRPSPKPRSSAWSWTTSAVGWKPASWKVSTPLMPDAVLGRAGLLRHGLLVPGSASIKRIAEALGADLANAIPELLRPADLEVRIPPRLKILALENLAKRDGNSVDAVLERELLDVVSAHSEYLAKAIPGFTAAFRWPQ
jgi:hypothetical protein